MNAVETIEKVIAAKLLSTGLTYVPGHGVGEGDLNDLQKKLKREFSAAHRRLLRRWNGLNLDIVRLYGAEETSEIRGLLEHQEGPLSDIPGTLVFGGDPAGFRYGELPDGTVVCYDSDGDDMEPLASDMDDFFARVVFGPDAESFAGPDWLAKLKAARLVE